MLPPILQLAPSLLNGLVPAFIELINAVKPLIPLLADLLVMAIKDILPAVVPVIPIVTQLGVAFVQMGAKVAQIVAQIKPAIEAGVAIFRWMYNILVGNSIIPDMVTAIGTWIGTKLIGWFSALPGKIKNAVSSIGPTMAGIAQDVVSGFWNKLQSLASGLYNNVRNFFANIVKSAKDALGIKSPSKVFAQIGAFMMQGMSIGVDKGRGLVVSSLKKVAGLATRTAMPDLSVPGVTVPDGLGGGRALSRTVVNVTNHYPQAEPTSVTVNRSLQYVGAMGVI
ncbi:hypothetical protein ACFQ0B_64920 [Nonomuraea thailandensis]